MIQGGDGGVHVDQRGGDIEPPIPTGPTVPDFILRRRAQALQTVREATQEEIAYVASYPARKTIISVQCGRVPRSPGEWLGVMTAASFLDRPLTEQGREARDNRDHLIGEIRKTHQAYQAMRATPPAPPSPVSTGLDDEEDESEERLSLERNWKLGAAGPGSQTDRAARAALSDLPVDLLPPWLLRAADRRARERDPAGSDSGAAGSGSLHSHVVPEGEGTRGGARPSDRPALGRPPLGHVRRGRRRDRDLSARRERRRGARLHPRPDRERPGLRAGQHPLARQERPARQPSNAMARPA